jgi:hypothetical protein
MANALADLAASLRSQVEKRLFAEYGAVFVTAATPPPVIIFDSATQVEAFQSSLSLSSAVFGDHEIQLQTAAIERLAAAAAEMAERGGSISARSADSGGRSYADTVALWLRNVTRGLEHWEGLGRITSTQAQKIRDQLPVDQVSNVLGLEDSEQLFFGTFFDRSILSSVAAPGASQHLAMLAFDVKEYQDPNIDSVLGKHGWYRTVPNDLPHFTYLGREMNSLSELGLRTEECIIGERVYEFWTPDIDRL